MSTRHLCALVRRPMYAGSMILLAGCTMHWGPRADRIDELVPPTGVVLDLALRAPDDSRRSISGELLEVRGDGLLLLANEVVLVPYTALVDIEPRKHPLNAPRYAGQKIEAYVQTLKPASRYPFGMNAGALASMLEAMHQTEVKRVEP